MLLGTMGSNCSKPVLVGLVERVGRLGLGHADAGQRRDDAQLLHHRQARAQGADVAQVAAGDDDPVGRVPVELLHDLDRHRLLPLEAQRVHAVGQVDALLGRQPLHQRHAVVEVAVDGQHGGPVGQRLHQLGGRDLAAGQDDQGADAGGRAVGGQGRRGVAGGGAGHRLDRPAVGDHLLDRGDQHRHAQVLERAGVRVAAELDPEVVDPHLLRRSAGPRTGWCRPRTSRRRSRRAGAAAPTPSCPTRPSRRATGCACSGPRTA